VLGVEECKLALMNPPPTWEQLCNVLRTSVGTKERNSKSIDQFFSEYDDEEFKDDVEAFYIDRKYRGRSSRGRGFRGRGYRRSSNFTPRSRSRFNDKPYGGSYSRTKKCYVCGRPGCWSTNHTEEERDATYAKFKATSNIVDSSRGAYQYFLSHYEGNKDEEEDIHHEEAEQLMLEIKLLE